MQVIVENISIEEIQKLHSTFKNMDTDNNGTIPHNEPKAASAQFRSELTETEVQQLKEAVSICWTIHLHYARLILLVYISGCSGWNW